MDFPARAKVEQSRSNTYGLCGFRIWANANTGSFSVAT